MQRGAVNVSAKRGIDMKLQPFDLSTTGNRRRYVLTHNPGGVRYWQINPVSDKS